VETIHGLVQKMLDSAGLGKEYKRFRLQEAWKEMVPANIVESTCSIDVVDGVLFVDVEDSETEDLLDSLKDKLLSRIQQKFTDPPVLSVRITTRRQRNNA